jgi:3-hydroxyisobutyrate dehydrogenase
MRIAVLGTGLMGSGMARNLAAAGHEVSAWNRTPSKAEGLGASVAATPTEALEGAEAVITMLTDGPAIDEVLPELAPDTLWVQMSTVGVDDTARFAARHPRFLDAPVLGSKPQAESGELLVLAAGADRPDEIFDAIASRVIWVADTPGAATRLKLTANHWVVNLIENVAETFALAEANGIDPLLFVDAIQGRPMDTPYVRLKGEMILNEDFAPMFSLAAAAKDVRLMLAMADEVGLELGLAPVTLARFERAIELGHGDEDLAAAWHASRPTR